MENIFLFLRRKQRWWKWQTCKAWGWLNSEFSLFPIAEYVIWYLSHVPLRIDRPTNQPTTPCTPYCHSLPIFLSLDCLLLHPALSHLSRSLLFRLLFQGQLIHGIAKVPQMRIFFSLSFSSFPSSFRRLPFSRDLLFISPLGRYGGMVLHPETRLSWKFNQTHTDWFFLADFSCSCFLFQTNRAYYNFVYIYERKKLFWFN